MSDKIRVFVVSDAHMARKMLVHMIQDEDDIEVVGEESTGPGGVIMLEEVKPDIVLLEVGISGGMKIPDIIREMHAIDEHVKVILCSDVMHSVHEVPGIVDADTRARDLITRPYRKPAVLRVIREVAREDQSLEF